MSFEEIIIPSRDCYSLSVRIYEAKNPKALVKFIHGMEEYQDRYEEFAKFLQANGFTVVTADLRGHGKSAPLLSHIADKNGHKLLIEDELVVKEYMKNRWPDVPLMLFAHSMGTIIARTLLQTESKEYDKVALSGYPVPMPVGVLGGLMAGFIGLFKTRKGHSKTLTNLAIGGFSKAIENAKTDLDWLSYNEENVQKYIDDPLCGVEFTIGSYDALFHLVGAINNASAYKNVNEDLPFLLISGKDDPCAGGEKGRNKSLSVLQKAGFKNIQVSTIEGMRHEILNEVENKKIYQEILDFLSK